MLTVNVRPEGVSVTGLGQRVKENTEVEVTCDVSRVKPAADIYWRKGPDSPLHTGSTSSGLNQDHKTFHLQSTYKVSFNRNDHNTKLYCLVTRHGDRTDVWATANQTISVAYAPSTAVTYSNARKPTEGGSMTLTCDITDGNPKDDIKHVTWKKGDITLPTSAHYTLSDNDKVLEISSLNHTVDDGNYSCAGQNEAGMGDFGVKLHLLVTYKPTVSVVRPDPVVEGQSVTIKCQSQARPAVTSVMWKKGQEVISVTTDSKYSGGTVQTPSLTIGSVLKTDAGEYTCQLGNDVGHGIASVTLIVLYKPYGQATVAPEDVTVAVGGQVLLTCRAPSESGHPTASWFMWSKDNSNFSSNTTDSLRLTPTEVTESGKYRCTAGNFIGESDHSDWTTVTVQGE
ncbi:hypothetical protein NP493_641g01008 [Ridgeia piscesae]|uniref:Ig-like domain-containing protein n=1 Tax=Ridgeia piscesae TaxID=27915 RepID=A0AAD9KU32_RIDPI|nr:hypothetical protein NP493_641g01008 [Ridgeia piscesae]